MGTVNSRPIEVNEKKWRNLSNDNILKAKNGRCLVAKGNIAAYQADVLVNLIRSLSEAGKWEGSISDEFRDRGGQKLFEEYSKTPGVENAIGVTIKAQGQLRENCKQVLCIYVQEYSPQSCLPLLQQLREKISWCLETTAASSLKSVAFPVLGGDLGYPAECIARCFLEALSICHPNLIVTIVSNNDETVARLREFLYRNVNLSELTLPRSLEQYSASVNAAAGNVNTALQTSSTSGGPVPKPRRPHSGAVQPLDTNNYEHISLPTKSKRGGIYFKRSNSSSCTVADSNNTYQALDRSNVQTSENVESVYETPISTEERVYENNPGSSINSLGARSSSILHRERQLLRRSNGIEMRSGSITKTKADALVCTVCGDSGDIDRSGFLFSEFLRLGGEELRQSPLCLKVLPTFHKPILNRSIISTKSCGELVDVCSFIFFVHVKNYDASDSSICLQYLTSNIEQCLTKARHLNLKSIGFPTIGCGRMNYPDDKVAQCFKTAVSSSGSGLQVIICAMTDMYDKFQSYFASEEPEPEVEPKVSIRDSSDGSSLQTHLDNREVCVVNSAVYVPEYWKIRGILITELLANSGHRRYLMASYSPVYKEVETLVQSTWQSQSVGLGRDAAGLTHNSIKVLNISCVENPSQFKKYTIANESLIFKKMNSGPLPQLEKRPLTLEFTGPILSKNLNPDINEYYLFHGTLPSNRDGITMSGLDFRLGNSSGLFGGGVYFAESSTKSDQYTGGEEDPYKINSIPDERYYMFLCRVAMGNSYECKEPRTFKKPPCKKGCATDTCSDVDHLPHHDSVTGTHHYEQRPLLFREFIVYDQHRCYPEFLVEYIRIYT